MLSLFTISRLILLNSYFLYSSLEPKYINILVSQMVKIVLFCIIYASVKITYLSVKEPSKVSVQIRGSF